MVFRDTQEVQNTQQAPTSTSLDGAYRQEDAEMFRNLNRQNEVANLTNLQIYTGDTSPHFAGQKKDPTAELDKPVGDPRLDRPVPETRIEVSHGRLQEGCGDKEQEGASEEDKRIAATLNKYFDQMDQSHWYTFGKDGELSKSEILEFLASDQGKNLSNQEIRDLLAASNQFDRIKGLHYYGVFALDRGSGITQADVSYLADGTSSFEQELGPLLSSLKGMETPTYSPWDLIRHKS
jgi:hypothetical protein